MGLNAGIRDNQLWTSDGVNSDILTFNLSPLLEDKLLSKGIQPTFRKEQKLI